jgi:hypothetical protein
MENTIGLICYNLFSVAGLGVTISGFLRRTESKTVQNLMTEDTHEIHGQDKNLPYPEKLDQEGYGEVPPWISPPPGQEESRASEVWESVLSGSL